MRTIVLLLVPVLALTLSAHAQPAPADPTPAPPVATPVKTSAVPTAEPPPPPVPLTPARFTEDTDITVGEAVEAGYQPRPKDEPAGSLSAGLLAIFPGVLIHGLGHYVADDNTTALKLLVTEVVAIGMIVGAALAGSATKSSGKYAGALGLLEHYGWALFIGSWVADVVGAFKGAESSYASSVRMQGKRLRLAYRYTRDPRTDFRHHLFVGLDLDFGWLYFQPELDVEGALEQRRYQIYLGGRLLRGDNPQNNLALGTRLRRTELAPFGISTLGVAGYVEARGDLGVWIRSLRNFYLFTRAGYGYEGVQIASDENEVKGVTTGVDYGENYLFFESGVSVNSGLRTNVTASVIVDETLDLAPIGANGILLDAALTHRYREDLDIEFHFTVGDAFAVWLGLEYGL